MPRTPSAMTCPFFLILPVIGCMVHLPRLHGGGAIMWSEVVLQCREHSRRTFAYHCTRPAAIRTSRACILVGRLAGAPARQPVPAQWARRGKPTPSADRAQLS